MRKIFSWEICVIQIFLSISNERSIGFTVKEYWMLSYKKKDIQISIYLILFCLFPNFIFTLSGNNYPNVCIAYADYYSGCNCFFFLKVCMWIAVIFVSVTNFHVGNSNFWTVWLNPFFFLTFPISYFYTA